MTEIEQVESGYLVSLAVTDGMVRLAFEEIEQVKSREINANLTVWREIPGVSVEAFSAPINILSLNARETYRRNLDDAFGKLLPWTTIINRSCGMLKAAWESRPRAIFSDELPEPTQDRFEVEPLCLTRGATIWFGDGESGKTTLAVWLASQLSPAIYVDYEWEGSEIGRLCRSTSSNLYYYDGAGVALADQVVALRRETKQIEARYLIIDSAAGACGGEPERAETAIRYFNALKMIGLPSLTIAHTTKSGEDARPFGSHFWHLNARLSWNIKADDSVEDELRIGFFCRKANVGRRIAPFGMRLSYDNGHIEIGRHALWDTFGEHLPTKIRIKNLLLAQGKLMRKEIADELGLGEEAVRKALQRMPDVASDGRSRFARWWVSHD